MLHVQRAHDECEIEEEPELKLPFSKRRPKWGVRA
jgi:hypothetical protein